MDQGFLALFPQALGGCFGAVLRTTIPNRAAACVDNRHNIASLKVSCKLADTNRQQAREAIRGPERLRSAVVHHHLRAAGGRRGQPPSGLTGGPWGRGKHGAMAAARADIADHGGTPAVGDPCLSPEPGEPLGAAHLAGDAAPAELRRLLALLGLKRLAFPAFDQAAVRAVGMTVKDPFDIGQHNQARGAEHGCEQRGEFIVVCEHQFGDRHNVVFVDHRDNTMFERADQAPAHVEVVPARCKVIPRGQDLSHLTAVSAKSFLVEGHQPRLPHGGEELPALHRITLILHRWRRLGQPERHRTGRDQHRGLALGSQPGDLLDNGVEMRFVQQAVAGPGNGTAQLDDDRGLGVAVASRGLLTCAHSGAFLILMGTQAASQYITAAGHQALKAEFERLWRRERPLVTKALGEAAAEGDRSENAEYIYRKKQLREMDRRIRYLSKRLDVLQVVAERPRDTSRIFFAARVTLEDDDGERKDFQLVGVDETLAEAGRISIDSPMARALLGRSVGDVVVVPTPRGEDEYEVLEIEYPDPKVSSYV